MNKILPSAFIGVCILAIAFGIRLLYPPQFSETVFTIEKGMNANQIATKLEENSLIRDTNMFKLALRVVGGHNSIYPGEYSFKKSHTVFGVAWRVTRGEYRYEQRRATIPEGSTNQQVAEIIKTSYPNFDSDLFLNKTINDQGYLFPDTYFFSTTSTDEVVSLMKNNFEVKTKLLQEEALSKGLKWNEIIIMASILEEEADTIQDFSIVSGVLWKRLEIGMALQVDVAPITYEERGFPNNPLSNPGLASINAALNPETSEYLFYITGKDGLMYYAKDFDAHRANIEAHLK